MAAAVSVTTDPLVVYGMVGLLLGALMLALVFSLPRPGLGAAKPSDVAALRPGALPWMPGGDILEREDTALPAETELPPPDPWSTSTGDPGAQPPWGTR